jgi:Tfp pilus assembly protein PilF
MFGYSMLSPKCIFSLVVIIASVLSGCVTSSYTAASHQKSPDELISLYLGHAKKNLQSGDQLSFASDIERALYQPNAVLSVNAYFSENPIAKGV